MHSQATRSSNAASSESADARVRRALITLQQKRIFFAHESVGQNLLDGLTYWFALHRDLRLAVVESENPAALVPGSVVHARLGHNGDPGRKLTRLRALAESGIAARADLVIFKLCYLDVNATTAVEALHGRIHEVFSSLRERYPRARFALMTVPITATQRGPRAWAKRVLRRPPGGAEDNLRRQALNQRLRRSEAELFDLAWLESLDARGEPVVQVHRGLAVPVMAGWNTDDGGHLNGAAQVRLARALVEFAAGLGEAPVQHQGERRA